MKEFKGPNEFGAYFDLPQKQKIQAVEKGTVVFDTSVLLGLYRIEPRQRKEILARLSTSLTGRVWLPHQVFLEFVRHRDHEMRQDRRRVALMRTAFQDKLTSLKSEVESQKLSEFDSSFETAKFNELTDQLRELLNNSVDKIAGDYPDLNQHDEVLETILRITHGSIGPGPADQGEIDALSAKGETRFAHEIPPGYLDKKKDGEVPHCGKNFPRKYGDWFVWSQLLDAVASDGKRFSTVLFVTQDEKDDWWNKDPENSSIKRGPRTELRQEIEAAGAKVYWQYTFRQFYELLTKLDTSTPDPEKSEQIREIENAEHLLRFEAVERATTGNENKLFYFLPDASHRRPEGYLGFESQIAVEAWLRSEVAPYQVVENRTFPDFWVASNSKGLLTPTKFVGVEVISPRDPRAAVRHLQTHLGQPPVTPSFGEVLRTYFVFALHPRAVENYPFGSWREAFDEVRRLTAGRDRIGLVVGVYSVSFHEITKHFDLEGPSVREFVTQAFEG